MYAKLLGEKCTNLDFCSNFAKALVSNHKQDASIGGGHAAQWSAGVEQIIKDSQINNAPKIIFPFKRAGRSSSQFLLHHAQLISELLLQLDQVHTSEFAKLLYAQSLDLVSEAPSEDQKNQIFTAAEIFAGISHGLLSMQPRYNICDSYWKDIVLPFFEKIIGKIPSSFLSVYSDALRFMTKDASPVQLEVPIKWTVEKMENTLWQEKSTSASYDSSTFIEGFAEQSKWIGLMCAMLAEFDLDYKYSNHWIDTLSHTSPTETVISSLPALLEGWNNVIYSRLVPCLLNAIGHPFQTCREHIAWCLFRVSNCFNNLSRKMDMIKEKTNMKSTLSDPTNSIIEAFKSLDPSHLSGKKEQLHGLITLRMFMSYCLHYGDNKNEYAAFLIPLLPIAFEAVRPEGEQKQENDLEPEIRMLRSQVVKEFRHVLAEISASCFVTYHVSHDVSRVLDILNTISKHEVWQVRNAAANFLRCFQGCHKFLFTDPQTRMAQKMTLNMLADERKEVSSTAMSALTGFLASLSTQSVATMVEDYIQIANGIIHQRKKKSDKKNSIKENDTPAFKSILIKQQRSVYFLCAAVLSRPYDTPAYTPKALATLSKHSYERNASFVVRETVKLCCREYKKTHMTDNWDLHRMQFTQEELEALDDVISTPHYYA
jgi:proteasome activator subunit 4